MRATRNRFATSLVLAYDDGCRNPHGEAPKVGGGHMNGVFLRFYMHENAKHRHTLLYEWLLEHAKKMGIHGGTAFRGIAGFGHHGRLHFQHFFELAGELPMQLDFLVSEEESRRLLDMIKREKVRLLYMKVPMQFGVLNPDATDSPEMAAEA